MHQCQETLKTTEYAIILSRTVRSLFNLYIVIILHHTSCFILLFCKRYLIYRLKRDTKEYGGNKNLHTYTREMIYLYKFKYVD